MGIPDKIKEKISDLKDAIIQTEEIHECELIQERISRLQGRNSNNICRSKY